MTKVIFFYLIVVISGATFSQIYNKDGSLIDFENATLGSLEQAHPSQEYDALETALLYLLGGVETWGSWLSPNNNIGLLPEAEARFMTSSTPILQAGTSSIGIGVVGFAQPITISHNNIPEGFSSNEFYESVLLDYNDPIEDVFEKVPYLNRLTYQYGVQITGNRARIYRKSIETELTLAGMLRKMGAPPEVAEIWVEEYAAVVNSPQTIQLAWLIAGNPLAKDYQSHIENVLASDLNALLKQGASKDSPIPTSDTHWVNQDPFWEEVQKQPFFNAFIGLLDGANEEIQRSFIVALFFLEPVSGIEVAGQISDVQVNSQNVRLRARPSFLSTDVATINNNNNSVPPTINPIGDPDQTLVAEALKQNTNLIKYWIPNQGYQTIPWSQKSQLNPNNQNYFIIAATALAKLEPRNNTQDYKANYTIIVENIVNNHLPQNQPVFKVFIGPETKDRRIVNNKGALVGLSTDSFLWSAEKFEDDFILQQASVHHKAKTTPYVVIHIDNGPYIAGSLPQLKELFTETSSYWVDMAVLRSSGTRSGGGFAEIDSLDVGRTGAHWLNHASNVAQNIFNWPFVKQDKLFIQSNNRSVQFEASTAPNLKVNTSSMVTWKNLPSNEELFEQRENWGVNIFLLQTQQGYFFIPTNELEYLQKYADEQPRVHTLLLSRAVVQHLRNIFLAHDAFKNRNLNCESIRVLADEGVELVYSPQCSLIVAESGQELAQQNEQKQLTIAEKIGQPIIIFRPENKPASAVYLRALFDVEQSSIEALEVNTLVPVYNLENLTAEEKEDDINLSVTDAIKRTLQFFPKQKEFEVLMPEGQHVKYTSTPPENFHVRYDHDKIDVLVAAENKPITFYRLGER